MARQHQATGPLFDFVFLDPPYADTHQYERVLSFLGAAPFLAPASLVIAEHRKTVSLAQRFGRLLQTRVLRQGDASLTFYQHEAAEPDEIPEAA